ncbi:unnamed protein product [Paramecium octaurelia]|uniref:CAAX prenyl protease n=1 Tax=Paramecium octaurelia TaxID=43137 RepID=A0A8S1W0I8_PAROT|nr:unnamed protein product [Paramecium octaurelia]
MAIQRIKEQEVSYSYLYIVVSYIVIKYLLEQFINLRQLDQLSVKQMPIHIEQTLGITQKQFKRSQRFYYDKLSFEMYTKSIKTAIEIIVILCGVMPFIWERTVTFFKMDPNSEFQRGLAYIFVEFLRLKLIDVPNNFYNTHVIEKRYDLSQISFALQFSDLVIESALWVVFVPILLYSYLYVAELGGDYFFIAMQLFVLIMAIVSSLVYPNYIQPLFNEFEELKETQLKQAISQLAFRMNFPLEKILVMDGSKRSDHSNAYFFGMYSKRIVLYDTLINNLTNEEIVAVVAHELGHWKYRHPYIKLLFFCIKILITFYIFGFYRDSDVVFLSFGFKEKSIFIGSALFFSLFEPMNTLFQIFELHLSRFFEYQADIFANHHGLGSYLMSGLIKLFKQNSTNLMVDPIYQWYYNSHPSLFERLKYLNKLR